MKKIIYTLLLIIVASIFSSGLRTAKIDSNFKLSTFGELPVQVGGRIKPLDSVARNTLLILSSRQKVVTDEGIKLSPIEWFMDLTMRPELADNYPVFKIEFPDDLGLAGLAQKGQRYYSYNDLLPYAEELHRLNNEINPEPKKRSPYEKQIAKINNGLIRYHQTMHSFHPVGEPERLDRLADEYQSYLATIDPGLAELRKQQLGEQYNAALLKRFVVFADEYLKLSQTATLRVVPPPAPVDNMEDWKNVGHELLDVMQGKPLSPYVTSYASLTMAYRSNDVDSFNKTAEELRLRFTTDFPKDIGRVQYERVFNAIQPFYISIQLYVLIFLVACISWLVWPTELSRAAFWLLILTFIIHTYGLLSRMYIQDRKSVV